MAPLRIEVGGESTIHHPAERAVLSITVSSDGPSQETVITDVTTASTQLRSLLEELAPKDTATGKTNPTAPVTRWTNSTLSTGSYFAYDDSARARSTTRTYTALTSFSVRFRDFRHLGSFTSTVSLMEHIKIGGIDWELTDETTTKLSSQGRHQAIKDAVTKAGDFASALGVRPLPVVEVRDSDGGGATPVYAMSRRAPGGAVAFGGGGMGPDEVLSFEPEKVTVQCGITVVFERKE